jgi:hypothetical protein
MHTSYTRLDALYCTEVGFGKHSGEFTVCTTIDQGDGDRGGSFKEIELSRLS